MAHFDEGSSLPPPFNIIITPKSVYYSIRGIINALRWLFCRYHFRGQSKRATIRVCNTLLYNDYLFQRPGYNRHQRNRQDNANDDSSKQQQQPLTYRDIMQRLIARFIHQTKKDMKMDGVNEDDLLEIKQDISSLRYSCLFRFYLILKFAHFDKMNHYLRYELRDDRRKEIVRSSSHIDAVKRDIMRTMSTTTRGLAPRRASQACGALAEEVFTADDDNDLDDIDADDDDVNRNVTSQTLASRLSTTSGTEAPRTPTGSSNHQHNCCVNRRLVEILRAEFDARIDELLNPPPMSASSQQQAVQFNYHYRNCSTGTQPTSPPSVAFADNSSVADLRSKWINDSPLSNTQQQQQSNSAVHYSPTSVTAAAIAKRSAKVDFRETKNE
jgi:hypothetical protein